MPNSRKIYVAGQPARHPRADARNQPGRHARAACGGEKNPPIFVYDSSGPYTDPAAKIDIRTGLPALRARWIEERGDTEALAGLSSEYGRQQAADPELAELRFPTCSAQPRRAKAGMNVTQMHYARQGIITPEMEFIAIRENTTRRVSGIAEASGPMGDKLAELMSRQHPGQNFGAAFPKRSRRNSCATKSRAAAPSSPPTSTTRNPSR